MERFVRLLSLIGILAQPVAAMAAPCCCTEPVQKQRACCPPTLERSASKEPVACCRTKEAVHPESVQADCQCAKSDTEFVPAAQNVWKPAHRSVDLAHVLAEPPSPGPTHAVVRSHTVAVRQFSPRGPELLAILCLWLK